MRLTDPIFHRTADTVIADTVDKELPLEHKKLCARIDSFREACARIQQHCGTEPIVLDPQTEATLTQFVSTENQTASLEQLSAVQAANRAVEAALLGLQTIEEMLSAQKLIESENVLQHSRSVRLAKQNDKLAEKGDELDTLMNVRGNSQSRERIGEVQDEIAKLENQITSTKEKIDKGVLFLQTLGQAGHVFRNDPNIQNRVREAILLVNLQLQGHKAPSLDFTEKMREVQQMISHTTQEKINELLGVVSSTVIANGQKFSSDWQVDKNANAYTDILATFDAEIARLTEQDTSSTVEPLALPDYLDVQTLLADLARVKDPIMVTSCIRNALDAGLKDVEKALEEFFTQIKSEKKDADSNSAGISKKYRSPVLLTKYTQVALTHCRALFGSGSKERNKKKVSIENNLHSVYETTYQNSQQVRQNTIGYHSSPHVLASKSKEGFDQSSGHSINFQIATEIPNSVTAEMVSVALQLANKFWNESKITLANSRRIANDDFLFNSYISKNEISLRQRLKQLHGVQPQLSDQQIIVSLGGLLESLQKVSTDGRSAEFFLERAMLGQLTALAIFVIQNPRHEHAAVLTDTVPLFDDKTEERKLQNPLPYTDWELDDAMEEVKDAEEKYKSYIDEFYIRLYNLQLREGKTIQESHRNADAQLRKYLLSSAESIELCMTQILQLQERQGIGSLHLAYRLNANHIAKATSIWGAAQAAQFSIVLSKILTKSVINQRCKRPVKLNLDIAIEARPPEKILRQADYVTLKKIIDGLQADTNKVRPGFANFVKSECENNALKQVSETIMSLTNRSEAGRALAKISEAALSALGFAVDPRSNKEVKLSCAHNALAWAAAYEELWKRWIGKPQT